MTLRSSGRMLRERLEHFCRFFCLPAIALATAGKR